MEQHEKQLVFTDTELGCLIDALDAYLLIRPGEPRLIENRTFGRIREKLVIAVYGRLPAKR